MSRAPLEGVTLAIETSSHVASLAVTRAGRVLAEVSRDSMQEPTESLLEVAESILTRLDLTVRQLDRIAFSSGPGSFTGLRVGMATALGLAFGGEKPLVAVPSLEVLAYPERECGMPIAVLSGLRRGQLYSALYRWEGERFDPLLAPTSGPVERLLTSLAATPGDRFLFVGDAVDSLRCAIWDRIGGGAIQGKTQEPRAADVAALASDPCRTEWSGRELEGRTPEYLRGADARKPKRRP